MWQPGPAWQKDSTDAGGCAGEVGGWEGFSLHFFGFLMVGKQGHELAESGKVGCLGKQRRNMNHLTSSAVPRLLWLYAS